MEQRPRSLVGLVAHVVKLKWSGLDRTRKLALVGVAVAVGLSLAMWSRCLLGAESCPTRGGCPYADSPCAR